MISQLFTEIHKNPSWLIMQVRLFSDALTYEMFQRFLFLWAYLQIIKHDFQIVVTLVIILLVLLLIFVCWDTLFTLTVKMNWKIITVLDYKIRIIFVQILLLQGNDLNILSQKFGRIFFTLYQLILQWIEIYDIKNGNKIFKKIKLDLRQDIIFKIDDCTFFSKLKTMHILHLEN